MYSNRKDSEDLRDAESHSPGPERQAKAARIELEQALSFYSRSEVAGVLKSLRKALALLVEE